MLSTVSSSVLSRQTPQTAQTARSQPAKGVATAVMFCKNNPNIKDDKLGNPMKNMNMIFGAPEFVPACFFWSFDERIILAHDV
jgi:hypothetical protein